MCNYSGGPNLEKFKFLIYPNEFHEISAKSDLRASVHFTHTPSFSGPYIFVTELESYVDTYYEQVTVYTVHTPS